MASNIINDGAESKAEGSPVLYSYKYPSAALSKLTFHIYAPGAVFGYNPPGVAVVEYFDPIVGGIATQSLYVGGKHRHT